MSKRQPLVKAESFIRGTTIGNYVVAGKLGEGSFGKVVLGVNKDTNKKYALKCIEMKNAKVINNVFRETRLQRILDHPNIVHLYEVFQIPEKNQTVMVLEYVNGGELFDYIVTRGKVDERDAIRLFRQMISAIEYCHYSLVVHRDLKPENILLDENRNAKIMDFGLANMMQAGEFLHTNCGSPIYSSPEILQSKDYIGPEVDIWSLGIILYVMVTGMCPWSGTTLTEQLKNAVVGRYEPADGVSMECADLIDRIITVDPKKRPTIAEIRNHPWVNRGYATKPLSHVPSSRHLKPNSVSELDEEVINRVVDLGFEKLSVINDLMNLNTTQPAFVYYYIMLDSKQRHQKAAAAAHPNASKTWSPDDFQRLKTEGMLNPNLQMISASVEFHSNTSTPRKEEEQGPFLPAIHVNSASAAETSTPASLSTMMEGVTLSTSPSNASSTSTQSTQGKKRVSIGLESIFRPQSRGKVVKPRVVKRMFLDKTTSKTVEEVQAEIEKAINVMRLEFKSSGLKYCCKEEVMDDKLKLDVEICRADDQIGLCFKRKSGSIWHYKDTVSRFCNTMNL
eukprot:TRINITY_DN9208_c0_g1_i1.p1 TRINITY_DN9208_c0_g1~~TRINITY_DN9208_c0_g1_i1.p1  ORF type:complete len:564 (-),score=134.88 TRINITY_DN9208_c0_g1_i1:37-1728(-)